MTEGPSRRLSLLYQLYLTSQASRRFMRLALAGNEMSGEEYAVYSYLFANGPRTLTQTAAELALPVTTLATLIEPLLQRGDIERRPHPGDRRAKLLRLTDAGRQRLEGAIPAFGAGYRALLGQLEASGADIEGLYAALGELQAGIRRTNDLLQAEASGGAEGSERPD